MTIVITAFERSPDGGKGLARDTRVRWALEEVGQPYEVRLLSFRAKKEPTHLRLHPFGLIPTYEEGDLALFETGVSQAGFDGGSDLRFRPRGRRAFCYGKSEEVSRGAVGARHAACVRVRSPDRARRA
jgi:hypothetical protein